jgi:hypothetical protein
MDDDDVRRSAWLAANQPKPVDEILKRRQKGSRNWLDDARLAAADVKADIVRWWERWRPR